MACLTFWDIAIYRVLARDCTLLLIELAAKCHHSSDLLSVAYLPLQCNTENVDAGIDGPCTEANKR